MASELSRWSLERRHNQRVTFKKILFHCKHHNLPKSNIGENSQIEKENSTYILILCLLYSKKCRLQTVSSIKSICSNDVNHSQLSAFELDSDFLAFSMLLSMKMSFKVRKMSRETWKVFVWDSRLNSYRTNQPNNTQSLPARLKNFQTPKE